MKKSLIQPYSRGYCLSLSDGNNWWITGDEDHAQWVDELASIMVLSECDIDDSPKIIFSRMGSLDDARGRMNKIALSQLHSQDSDAREWKFCDYETIRMWHHSSITDVIYEVENDALNEGRYDASYMNMWYALRPIYERSIWAGGVPFHATLVERDGRGVLLAGEEDTGKSTCYRRIADHWTPLCDDEVLVVLDKQKEYRAHPFPTWSDYLMKRAKNRWDIQYSVPLCGIFFLEQSEVDEALPIGAGEAAVLINESATQVCHKYWRKVDIEERRKLRKELFSNICRLARAVPAFVLRLSLHGRFWEVMESVMSDA